jgi:hypothetical protein
MPLLISDPQSFPIGTAVIVIGGESFVVESANYDEPTSEVIAPDIVGSPRLRAQVGGLDKGSITVALDTTASLNNLKKRGEWFIVPTSLGLSGSAFSASVDSISNTRAVGDYWKATFGFTKKLN